MRLQEIKQVLIKNQHKLDIYRTNTSSGYISLEKLIEFREAINEIHSLNLFEQTLKIKDSFIFRDFEDSMFVTTNAWDQVKYEISSLKYSIDYVIKSIDKTNIKENENTIAIKLPQVIDFSDFTSVLNELKKAISVPISEEEIGGKVEIKGVENGSIWMYIALGTPSALALIAGLAWAATVIYKKLQEGRAFNEYVKNLQLKNDQAEAFVEAQKAQVLLLVTEQAKLVEKENFSNSDAERLERLKLSINTMSELIDKGFEIHPSLVAPESVTNLFPDFKSIHLPSFEKKQIGAGEEEVKN